MKVRVRDFALVALTLVLVTSSAWAQATRILSQSGDPRIMQFGVKYGF